MNSNTPTTDKQDKMYCYASMVKNGTTGKPYVYCMEDDRFYAYENNYWHKVLELDLIGDICESIPKINKYTLATKNQVVGHLRMLVRKKLECFNSSNFLNFPDGEFNPITHKLHEHNKEHYSTIRMPYSYNISSKCPLWEKTLNEIFEGDKNKFSSLQEFFGYCLVPDVKQKKAMLLLGESNSGKSTILFILRAMIGDANCSSVPLKHLGHPQYAPMMINKLVNIDTDVSKNADDYEEDFKKITSGEPITCNQKFIETFEFVPKCRLVLAANIFPKITDHSSAFYNRLILIPCDRVFEEHEQDKSLVPKLKEELPGIFNWALDGLKRLNERGMFEKHGYMAEAVKDLENENNPVNLFFDEHLEVCMGGYVEKGELYDKYKAWSEQTKNYALSLARFGNCINKNFGKLSPKNARLPNNGKRVWKNIQYVPFKGGTPHEGKQQIEWQE